VVGQAAAAQLFVQRAQAVQPDFALSAQNAAAVAQICQRVDGLPLALELAAARVRVLPPHAMLERLERRLTLLIGGALDLPARQRTLRETIGWSYDLLTRSEQMLFRRLAVFAGGCSLSAIEGVCNAAGDLQIAVLDGLEALERNSLLRQEETAGGEPRFLLLETIREYALERLAESREEEELRKQHATYFLEFAEEGGRQLYSAAQVLWLDRLEQEHDNLRVALRWCIEGRNAEVGLRLAAALWLLWYIRGYLTEGRAQVMALLAMPVATTLMAPRAEALLGAGQLARTQGDYAAARELLEESLAINRSLGDERGTAYALLWTGFVARVQEEYSTARALLNEALALSRLIQEMWVNAAALHHLGMIASDFQEDYPAARSSLEESLALYRTLGPRRYIALVLLSLGDVARAEAHHASAHGLLRESLTTMIEVGERLETHWALDTFAHLASDEGRAARAVRLAGAAARLREAMGSPSWPVVQRQRDRWLASARTALDDEVFAAAWAEGQAMSREQAIAYALAEPAR
jgi:non-specific serine/threonine protein kinase